MVTYFSATGNTQAVAERIIELTGADVYRIRASVPYASNPYDDSDRIQNEAYNDLRPGVANLLSAETIAQYDTILSVRLAGGINLLWLSAHSWIIMI